MGCPDENTLAAFATGALDHEGVDRVVRHIDTCPSCAALVADAAAAVESEPQATLKTERAPGDEQDPANADAPLPPGTFIDRYVVLELLGAGGLGLVYTCYDPELDRRVAVKVLRRSAEASDTAAARWARREAQAMAKLSHPHVVPVHDVGTFSGRVFVAMKLVEGRTFRTWVREANPSWVQIRDVLYEAGRGLAAAHATGLVHRDFKPANVLVDNNGRACVVDFGLARAFEAIDDPGFSSTAAPDRRLLAENLSGVGTVVGTPAYMAPEQLSGNLVDPRADQFSFCVTAYEAFFSARPFTGRSIETLLESIHAGPPTPSSGSVPGWLLRAVLPQAFWAIC